MNKLIKILKMKRTIKIIGIGLLLAVASIFILPELLSAQHNNLKLTVNVYGIYKSKISIIPLSGARQTPLGVVIAAKENNPASFSIPERHLPGEFLLRFEFHESKESSRPYTSDKMIILNDEDTKLWINPKQPNNYETTYFHEGEKENNAFIEFMQQNNTNLEMLDLLQNFLLSYDNIESDFYKSGIDEFNNRRKKHNSWIDSMKEKHKGLFTASLFSFYYVPEVNWVGSELERQQSLIDGYFYGVDFDNEMILKSSSLRTWMDNYVNLYVDMAINPQMTDSLFTQAGYQAIESAKSGHPDVYGWMVDYFFNGYESLDIQMGIEMLAPYIADPNCRTGRRKEIERRLEGIQSLTPGTIAPDFSFKDTSGEKIKFSEHKTDAPYKLVLFWSADCGHCVDMARNLHRWQTGNLEKLEVYAISLDETETEIPKWNKLKNDFKDWIHILAKGGINSPHANSYFILSTPSMFLVDSKTGKIIISPSNINDLDSAVK